MASAEIFPIIFLSRLIGGNGIFCLIGQGTLNKYGAYETCKPELNSRLKIKSIFTDLLFARRKSMFRVAGFSSRVSSSYFFLFFPIFWPASYFLLFFQEIPSFSYFFSV